MKRKQILGISCGVGVPLWAFRDQKILACFEGRSDFRLAKAQPQVKLNFPDLSFKGSTSVDIVMGHPKCGSSSMLALSRGKQFTSHIGEPSLQDYFEGLKTYMPEIWFLENLPKLLDSYPIKDIDALLGNSYHISHFIATADQFGNSQTTRKRLIVTGVRKDVKYSKKISKALSIPFKVANPTITRKLLRKLPKNGHFREPISEEITLYAGTKKTWKEIQDLWLSLYPKRHIPTPSENFNTAPGVYINWSNNTPLVARKSNRQFNPQGLPLTPRELCRIQGIPDDFLLLEPSKELSLKTAINKGRVVAGNTPPYEVALWFREVLENTKYIK